MHNSKCQCHVAASRTYHQATVIWYLLTNSYANKILNACLIITKHTEKISGEKVSRMAHYQQKNDKTGRGETALGMKTGERERERSGNRSKP